MNHDDEKLEYISQLQTNLGRLRCELVIVATAIKGDGIRLSGIHPDRIFTAAELIEKTQNELNVLSSEITSRRRNET